MLFYIWAAEDSYEGLHGIEDYGVFNCRDVEEAKYRGLEMSLDVIESYGIEDQYDYEDGDDIDAVCREHTVWEIRKIKDEYSNMTAAELDAICCPDPDSFIEEYTEEVDF